MFLENLAYPRLLFWAILVLSFSRIARYAPSLRDQYVAKTATPWLCV